jgi:hypothetical protein
MEKTFNVVYVQVYIHQVLLGIEFVDFLSGEHVFDLLSLMKNMEKIFNIIYVQGDYSPSSANALAQLHSKVLIAWGLCHSFTVNRPGGEELKPQFF